MALDVNVTSIDIKEEAKRALAPQRELADEEKGKEAEQITVVEASEETGVARVTFRDVKHMVETGKFARNQHGRFFVALSLFEAESLRGLMHLRADKPLIPGMNAAVGLRVGSILLDSSLGYKEAEDYQLTSAEQTWRFVDGETYFNESCSNLVLRSIQANDPKARQSK